MLQLDIPSKSYLNEDTNEIITVKDTHMIMEHSLISLQKWEQKWHIPFLSEEEKTSEQLMDYIKFMTINSVDENVYLVIQKDPKYMMKIIEYIQDDMTATWFKDNTLRGAQKKQTEVITAEIIYYWMVSYNIPVEFQKWHLNTLLTLIKVISIKNQKPEKMHQKDVTAARRAQNAALRAKYKTKG